MSENKILTDQLRKELEPELDALAKHYFEKGKAAGPGGTFPGAGAGVRHADALALAARARQKMAASVAIGVPMTNEESVRLAYEEAGASLE
jgi:hypothetical protein